MLVFPKNAEKNASTIEKGLDPAQPLEYETGQFRPPPRNPLTPVLHYCLLVVKDRALLVQAYHICGDPCIGKSWTTY